MSSKFNSDRDEKTTSKPDGNSFTREVLSESQTMNKTTIIFYILVSVVLILLLTCALFFTVFLVKNIKTIETFSKTDQVLVSRGSDASRRNAETPRESEQDALQMPIYQNSAPLPPEDNLEENWNQTENGMLKKELEVRKLEIEVCKKESALKAMEISTLNKEKDLIIKTQELERKTSDFVQREQEIIKKEEILNKRLLEVSGKEEALKLKGEDKDEDKSCKVQDKELKKKERYLQEKEKLLNQKQEELTKKEQELNSKGRKMDKSVKEKDSKNDDKSVTKGLTVIEKQSILDSHNYYRSQVARGLVPKQPAGSNLVLMEWDERAAVNSAKWMATCSSGHNSYDNRKFGSFDYVGQNIAYWSWTGVNISKAVDMWHEEYQFYEYNTKKCSQVCGHYTQVVWASTSVLGCGKASCTTKWKTQASCDYAEAGNFNNRHPYKAGPACSACPANYPQCHHGLCATVKQCLASGMNCTNSTTVSQSIKVESNDNPDKIVAHVPEMKP